MPLMSESLCGGLVHLPTAVPSKYRGLVAHDDLLCTNIQATVDMDFVSNGWSGQDGSCQMSLLQNGFSAGGTPRWKFNGSFGTCNATGAANYNSVCPPSTVQVATTLDFACCPYSNIGFMLAHGGVVEPNSFPPSVTPDCCEGTCSIEPVRYATGEIVLQATDIRANGYGQPWGHSRSFASRQSSSETLGHGFNWKVREWSYAIIRKSNSLPTIGVITTVIIQGKAQETLWFDTSGSGFIARFGLKHSLVHDSAAEVYRLTYPDGTVVEFDDGNGAFQTQIDPGGAVIEVKAYLANGFHIAQVERAYTANGHTIIEQLNYEYSSTSGDQLLTTVTLRRKIDAGAWSNVTRANYTYYGYQETFGGQEDLKTVTTQTWDGSAWQGTGTSYYRYYPWFLSEGSSSSSSSSSSGSGGFNVNPLNHLLMYVVNPAAYDRMVAASINPLTASNVELALFADYYFEYDDDRRLTKETVKSGSQTFLFDYAESEFDNGVNSWKTKTTETLPDGNQNIVYSNYAGQTMLKVFRADSDEWVTFYRYNNDFRVALQANPSAVTGYDEAYADLLNYDSESGTYEFLRDDEGLIYTKTYHACSGFVASESLQQGQLGTSIKLREIEYTCCGCASSSSSSSSSSGGGCSGGVWFVFRETVYPSDTNQTLTQVTSHAYSFHSGTCAVKEHVTTLPVVDTDQNGSGVAATRREYFDTYGNLIWTMDERGFITRMVYDIPTGALTEQVADVDTSLYDDVPAGWSTPSGGGLDLVTDFESDDQGRIAQSLGPSHTIDLDGSETTVRTASWTVYDDVNHITYSGQGYATGTAPDYEYTLIDPVSITKMDASGRVNEQIQATAPSTSGTLAEIIEGAGGGEDAFPQSSYTRWTTMQYTDCCLAASQRVYHTIPASGEGTSGTNYDETDFGYNVMKRRNRTVTPGGTITDLVYEPRGMVVGTYVGTNDDGATENDPTGGGLDPDNNMVVVTGNEYDNDADGGDGNLTEMTQHVDDTTTRVTDMTYDFRNRRVTTDGEVDYFEKSYYDNLDRVVMSERYDTSEEGNLIARSETLFDDRGRVYQSIRYAVDPDTGDVGNSLTDNTWFDAANNVIKSLPSGSQLFTKTEYDSLNRPQTRYTGYDLDETSYPN